MPTMPNIVGQELETAQNTLQTAGVVDQQVLGYFGTWPITVTWTPYTGAPGIVSAQSPASGNSVTVNAAVSLTVQCFKMGAAYP